MDTDTVRMEAGAVGSWCRASRDVDRDVEDVASLRAKGKVGSR